ncbi:MAG: hypothetical protein CL607_11005 [Anaerolineaceae bacterium]|nr:hypothetical protein [Anaerolineaceae bacterium]
MPEHNASSANHSAANADTAKLDSSDATTKEFKAADTRDSITVMLVNDNKSICQLWERVINRAEGMHCIGFAINGEAAVELAREEVPQIVLMDVMMPGRYNGYDATRVIVSEMPQVKVIIYSAYTNTQNEAFEAGASEYLLMPITPDKLLDTIRDVAKTEK